MKKRTLSEQIIILIVIVVGFYLIIVLSSDIGAIIEQTNKIDYTYLPIISFFMIIQIVFLGIKFHRLLLKLRINLPLKESMKIFTAGLSLIVTPGGMGTAIKSHIIKKKYGIPISSTLPIVLVERLTELIGVLLILTFFLVLVRSYESIIAVILGFAMLFLLMILISNNKIFGSVKKLVTKINRIKKLSIALDESQESYCQLMNKKTFFEAIGWSVVAKACQFWAVYFVFVSLGIDLEWFEVGEILHTSIILGIVSFIPTGIVVIESTMIALLIKNNIEFSLATLTVILFRIVTTWTPMIVGLFALKKTDYKTSEIS